MKNILVLALVLLALSACQESASTNWEPAMDCHEYCQDQPHAMCLGGWEISGEYPDCQCRWECTESYVDVEEDAATEEQMENDEYRVWSSDGKFYVQVGNNPIDENGWALYFAGNEDKIADKVVLGGPGAKDLSRVEVWIEKDGGEPRLKSYMHRLEDDDGVVFDASLRSGDTGTLTFKLYNELENEWPTDLKIKIAPE